MVVPSDSYPMQVVLLEENHFIRSIWLPSKKEGRYVFETDETDSEVPIVITASDNEWIVNLTKGAHLIDGELSETSFQLYDECLLKIEFGEKEYSIYSQYKYNNEDIYIPFYIEEHTDITIGRLEDNDICYPNPYVSKIHAVLHWENGYWYIIDADSKNGVFLNGFKIKSSRLELGDVIYIMGLNIIFGKGYIGINNANERITINSPKLHRIRGKSDISFAPGERHEEDAVFDRKPRRKFQIEKKVIDIELPPVSMSSSRLPLLLRLGNPIVSGGRAIMTGNAFSAITSLVIPALTQGLTEKDRKEYEKRREEKYREYLKEKELEIKNEISSEKKLLSDIYPDLNTMLLFPAEKSRLWERRKFDDDFLSVRLGSGRIPMYAEKNYQTKKFDLEQDSLLDEMYELAGHQSYIHDAPIMMSLKSDYITSIVGDYNNSINLVRNIIVQLAVTHAYDELKIVAIINNKDLENLYFLKYLPHCWNNEKSIRFIAINQTDAQQLSKYLNDELMPLFDDNSFNNKKVALKTKPSYVIFATNKKLFDSIEILKKVIQSEEYSNVSVVTSFEGAPKECSKLISTDYGNTLIDLKNPSVPEQKFTADIVSKNRINESMNEIMKTKLRIDSQTSISLPNMISFLELYGVGRVEHLVPLKKWADNNPVKSLAAPIGIGTDGKTFVLDLHEKRQGPHGLIAGGTGSGKSEFIITYILSMAVNYSPDEVSFILIDYKGGGLADAFVNKDKGIHLPHVVGTITNLDGASIQRSLMSINSELKRRQEVFKKVKSESNEGTMDIYDYQKLYRNHIVKEPMPHLFIISDEFAELKKQQPEFMDELISTARIGRSLGVHLILATQKPSGVVNDQIWSNTKFRVCLRVADKGDSMEMLKRPEAAEIKNTGRFYLQVGYNELFALGQSAWCGAGYFPQDEVLAEEDKSVSFIDTVGQVTLNAKPKPKFERVEEGKQIVSIVKYLSDLAKQENIIPKRLWCNPLSENIDLEPLLNKSNKSDNRITALIGMADDPSNQKQFEYSIDMQSFHHMLICGGSSSGKSSLIRTMLYSLIERYSPEELNYYILDMSGGALASYSKANHCGAYLTENNEADFDRLISMIEQIVNERKKLFALEEVTSFDAYIRSKKLPMILFIIDNYSMINNFSNGPTYHSSLFEYMKECSPYGIKFVLSANHLNEVHSRTRQEIDYRIALQAKDKYEYTDILDFKCNFTVPMVRGRGICVINERALEFHTAILDAFKSDQERVQGLKARIQRINMAYQDCSPARSLPMVDGNEPYEDFIIGFEKGRIPLGYSLIDMKKIAMPLRQLYCASLYFGNPDGVKPIFSNIITAVNRDNAQYFILKKSYNSIFDSAEKIGLGGIADNNITILDSTKENLIILRERIIAELSERIVCRDNFCEINNIPQTDKSRVLKAENYIRSNTQPLFVVFESFGDICRFERDEEIVDLEETFQVFFEKIKGYNIYFIGLFYSDDSDLISSTSKFLKSFNKQQFCLLFGGRYDKQCVINSLPMEFRRFEKVNPQYDKFIMKYKDEFYSMRMPCGELKTTETDPDDVSII